MIRNLFLDNLGIKILSILLSIGLFLYARLEVKTDSSIGTNVKLVVNPPPGFLITNNLIDKINVTINGPWTAIKRLDLQDLPPLKIDLSNQEAGKSVYYLNREMITLPPGLIVTTINPAQVKIFLEKKVEKTVPVVANIKGKVANGYNLVKYEVSPKKIKISGPAGDIRNIEFLMTEHLDITDLFKSFSQKVKITFSSAHIQLITPEPYKIAFTIQEELAQKTFLDVPINHSELLHNLELVNQKAPLKVKGPKLLLDSIDSQQLSYSIKLPSNFDPNNLQENNKLKLEVTDMPKGVTIIGDLPWVEVRKKE